MPFFDPFIVLCHFLLTPRCVHGSTRPQGYLSLLERDLAGEFRKVRPLVPDGVERHRMVLDALEKLNRK